MKPPEAKRFNQMIISLQSSQIFALLIILTGICSIFIQNSSQGEVQNGNSIQYSEYHQDILHCASSEVNLLPKFEGKNNIPPDVIAPGQGGIVNRVAVLRQDPYSRSFHSRLDTGIKPGPSGNNVAFSTIRPAGSTVVFGIWSY